MNKKPILGYPANALGTGGSRADPFDVLFNAMPVQPEDVFAGRVNALVFWGGEDISPVIYKAKPSRKAGTARLVDLGWRDNEEVPLYEAAVAMGIPIIGVCRGAQLACAMSGGRLVQHVENHGGHHAITTDHGLSIITNSIHHQMMWPFEMDKKDYQLLAWTSDNRSSVYVFDDDDVRTEVKTEPEIIWFPKTKALAIQGHPEFMDPETPFVQHVLGLVETYIIPNMV